MTSKRTAFLMAILLLLVGAALAWPSVRDSHLDPVRPMREQLPPLPGNNEISQLEVKRGEDGLWRVSFEYFNNGAQELANLYVTQTVTPGVTPRKSNPIGYLLGTAKRGRHRMTRELQRPDHLPGTTTEGVRVYMEFDRRLELAAATSSTRIDWPDAETLQIDRQLANSSPEAVVNQAIALIDTNNRHNVDAAAPLLQRVVQRYPRMDTAYVELARVAMKSNWSPEGLRQAESLIKSALEIRPDSVDAKILLGYVYANQKRFKESEPLFVEASQTDTKNLWLWANWGQLLELQGREKEAIAKYRVAIDRPPVRDKNERAREWTYHQLFGLYEQGRQVDAVEALHRQRVADYGAAGCPSIAFGRFLVVERGDAAGAMQLLKDQGGDCAGWSASDVVALAQYVAWAQGQDPVRADMLRQARAALPVSPRLFVELAGSDRTLAVVKQLIATGEKLDMQDNGQWDALSHAVGSGNAAAARRLLALGAKPTALVGPEKMPVALLPVLSNDLAGIRLMQKAGVDYGNLRYRGTTALEHARQQGDDKLLRALDPKSGSL